MRKWLALSAEDETVDARSWATAATWAGENGIDDGVIKRLFNHVPDSRDITALAYNHATKLDARREALQKWADYLESL